MQNKVNQESYALIFKALLSEPMSIDAMQNLTGLHRQTLHKLMRCFKRHKIVYISDWEQDTYGRDSKAVYAIGEKKDKRRYCMTHAERAKRYRDRKKIKLIPTSIRQMGANLPYQ
jgi:hypothetical protein